MDSFSRFHFDYSGSSSCSMSNINNNSVSRGKKKNTGKRSSNNNGVVKLSTDPQSVAARERRHRISDRFKILQSMVPGGSKMDTVSMLEEAINYVKFLKNQILLHQSLINSNNNYSVGDYRLHDPSFNCLPNYYHSDPPHQGVFVDGNNFVGSVEQQFSYASNSVTIPDVLYKGDDQFNGFCSK